MKIALIIVHYGKIDITAKCIKSIENSEKNNIELKIIIINNDPEINFDITINIPHKIINNKKNEGFSKAVNKGIKEALKGKADKIILVNNDITFKTDTLNNLKKSPYDIYSPLIHFLHDGSDVYDFGGKLNKWTGRTYHFESFSPEYDPRHGKKIDYVSGAFMCIQKDVFKKIGFFDERFFFYFEDVDFCLRAKKVGLKIGVESGTIVDHELSATIGKWSKKAINYMITGNAKFIHKNLGVRKFVGFTYLSALSLKILLNSLNKK